MTNENILNTIKNILGLPVEQVEKQVEEQVEVNAEKQEINLEAEVAETNAEVEIETPEETADTATETPEMEQMVEAMAQAVADLQSRVANLEAQLTATNDMQSKLTQIVEVLSKQPAGEKIQRTESAFSNSGSGIKKQKTGKDLFEVLKQSLPNR